MFNAKYRFIILIVISALLFSNSVSYGCSDIVVNKGEFVISARTMDFDVDMNTKVVLNQKGVERKSLNLPAGENPLTWTSKYGSITMDCFALGASDGMNQEGFSAAFLWLQETQWPSKSDLPEVALNDLILYCLDTCKTAGEAVENLKKIRICPIIVPGVNNDQPFPLHIVFHDATGDSAVVEYINGEMIVYHPMEQPVVTNDPPYSQQIECLNNHKLFGGEMPLLWDMTPVSHFVRAASLIRTLPVPGTDEQAVSWTFDIIKNVSVPTGAYNKPGEEITVPFRTQWTCIRNHKAGVYYFTTADNFNIRYVDLNKIDFSKLETKMEMDINEKVTGDVSKYFKQIK